MKDNTGNVKQQRGTETGVDVDGGARSNRRAWHPLIKYYTVSARNTSYAFQHRVMT